MKTRQKVGLVAAALFAVSHCLPAYGEGIGFACFRVCWEMLLGHDATVLSGSWFYYSGFVFTNVLFIGLVVSLFVTPKYRAARLALSIILALHVLSWVVLHLFEQVSELSEIKVGYYVWLAAYALLIAAQGYDRSLEPVSPVHPAPLPA